MSPRTRSSPGALTRREFLTASLLSAGSLAFTRLPANLAQPEFPEGDRLGRVIGGRIPLKARPDIESEDVGVLNEDDVVIWLREITGRRPLWNCQRFVETSQGYVFAPNLQPVRNSPNQPLETLPDPEGIWVEVTIPYVDIELANPPARSPWLKLGGKPRLYYSQILFVDQVRMDEEGQVWYRVGEKYGTFGDVFWARAEGLRAISPDEILPIHPEVEEKRIEVNLIRQTLSAYEGPSEVYFCTVSTGGKYDKDGNPSDHWATPVGTHTIWRKLVSVHMTGGTAGGGYDLAGIGWTVLFSSNGVALHSTFWHNNFGAPMSHGCVNLRPEDAKWLFRWTNPPVDYLPGDQYSKDAAKPPTKVTVIEG